MTRISSPPQPLKLPEHRSVNEHSNFRQSPTSVTSPRSPNSKQTGSRSTFKFSSKKSQAQSQAAARSEKVSKSVSDVPHYTPSSPPTQNAVSFSTSPISLVEQERQERRERPSRSSFFNNYMASRSQNRLQSEPNKQSTSSGSNCSKDFDKVGGFGSFISSQKDQFLLDPALSEISFDLRTDSPPTPPLSSSTTTTTTTTTTTSNSNTAVTSSSNSSKKSKSKPFNILSRVHSMQDDSCLTELSSLEMSSDPEKAHSLSEVTSAPSTEQDRSYCAMIASNVRHHSSERIPSFHRDRSKEHKSRNTREQSNSKSQIVSNLQKEHTRYPQSVSGSGAGNNFLSSLKSQATKGAGAISKGLFGKTNRGGVSSVEKLTEIDDENYELKVINLPLVQQTRLTRISKKLEDSRDKTEFWMPAFPWRAIDYLNYKGSDVEGLYRVPGSGPEIKKWRRRFDQELDIDLFEQHDLYDINIIGSMLKAWLRELPDELLPKAAQDRIARECATSEKVPQLLIDELSNLSPFNYYLLFAITCHLSLLLAHSEKNKMDYRNLCICFQPCMKIDAICFRFLVCEWRDCWKGCKTESYYVEQEYLLFEQQAQNLRPPLDHRSSSALDLSQDDYEQNISGSDSSKSSSMNDEHSHKHNQNISQAQVPSRSHTTPPIQTKSMEKPNKKSMRSGSLSSPHTPSKPQLIATKSTNSISSTTPLTISDKSTSPNKKVEEMRPLSPIKPLSPMGF